MSGWKKADGPPRPYETERWGILNHLGQIWTPQTFDSSDDAQSYIASYQRGCAGDLSGHRPVRVLVAVSVIHDRIEPSAAPVGEG